MAIIIREYLGSNNLSNSSDNRLDIKESLGSNLSTITEGSIMVDIEGIHEYPFHTRNYTRYMKSALKGSIPSWTKPYLKPLIMHHNDKDGKIIGRIHHVEYSDKDTYSGTGALVFTVNVPDSEGKEEILDGRLMTTSIGVTAHEVRCSICNHDIAKHGECEHERGRMYDKEICYWDIYEMEGKELSYVIVPSDIYSKNRRIYSPTDKSIRESMKGEFELKEKKEEKLKESEKKESVVVDELIPEDEEKEEDPAREDGDEKDEDKEIIDDLTDIRKELESVKQDLQNTINDLEVEKKLREALENEIADHKKGIREAMEEDLNKLRESSGKKPLSKEALENRTNESIADSIADIKEDLLIKEKSSKDIKQSINESVANVKEGLSTKEKEENKKRGLKESNDKEKGQVKVTKIDSPTLKEDDKSMESEGKDDEDDNIDMDLSEEVERLFSGLMGSRTS